jgi:ParB-like nuclease domain
MKPRKWRDALKALRSDVTYEDLLWLQRTAKPSKAPDEPRVPIKSLVVAEKAFQWRGEHSDLQGEERHMRELMRALELDRKLQPIVVSGLSKKLYVVDGHHRLAAYAAMGKTEVPVVYFKGTVEEAFLKSLDLNIRDKLPITRQDKYEAAFRLVKHKMRYKHSMTWDEIADRAVVSGRLVYKMQATLRDHPEAREWSWAETLGKVVNVNQDYQPGSEEFRDEHARKMADQIMSKVRMNLTANPDITARALAMISEELPRALIEEWQEEVREVLIEEARDANSEEAEEALRNAFRRLSAARAEEL